MARSQRYSPVLPIGVRDFSKVRANRLLRRHLQRWLVHEDLDAVPAPVIREVRDESPVFDSQLALWEEWGRTRLRRRRGRRMRTFPVLADPWWPWWTWAGK